MIKELKKVELDLFWEVYDFEGLEQYYDLVQEMRMEQLSLTEGLDDKR